MNIEFIPVSELAKNIVPPPKPAKNYIPDWYKNIKVDKDVTLSPDGTLYFDGKIKKCVPFLDSFTHGYIQESWTDIFIKKDPNGSIVFSYAHEPQIMHFRDKTSIPISDKFYPIEFIWQIQWLPKMPKGWSVMMTSPSNRLDLPFRSLTGIVDSDHFYHGVTGNYPFFIENGFEGIIPAGTPIYQIIPIKRENWKSTISNFDSVDNIKRNYEVRKHFTDAYRRLFWQKKNFE